MTDRENEQLLATATDRFERRLSEEVATLRDGHAAARLEIANLRGEMHDEDAATRLEIAKLRVEVHEGDAATRLEIARLRVEMHEGDSATRAEIANLRVDMSGQFAASRVHSDGQHREMLKWTIVLWVGQAAAVAGIVSALT